MAGGSGSGKSALSFRFRDRFPSVGILDLDAYYLDRSGYPSVERTPLNFDELRPSVDCARPCRGDDTLSESRPPRSMRRSACCAGRAGEWGPKPACAVRAVGSGCSKRSPGSRTFRGTSVCIGSSGSRRGSRSVPSIIGWASWPAIGGMMSAASKRCPASGRSWP